MFNLNSGPVVRCLVPALLVLAGVAVQLATWRIERSSAALGEHRPAVAYSAATARFPAPNQALRRAIAAAAADAPFLRGQTLSEVLESLPLAADERHELTTALAEHTDLRKLRPEDSYAAVHDPQAGLSEFRLTLAGRGRVAAKRRAGRWHSSWQPFVRTVRLNRVEGVLEGALEASIQRAGASPRLAYEMAEVLQWDLDFNRDLRLGDRFALVFEEVYLDGRFESIGAILALHYVNGGRRLEAYRFGEPAGYYDAEGRPLRKLFLRSPLRYSRVTSRFSHRRFHPILKRYRPHYGVDYGAPTGTPVRATAGGTVAFAAWDSGGGRMVKIRHPSGYLTAYLHLSRFAPGVRRGRRVAQGDVIGYVGATGLATAPHLDYRVQLNGRWINPLAMKMEPAPPLREDQRPAFEDWRHRLELGLAGGDLAPLLEPAETPRFATLSVGEPARPLAAGS